MELEEKTGDKFSLEKYFEAQELCRRVVDSVAEKVTLGMNEIDGQSLIRDEFSKVGIQKFWHPSKFRIGSETMKSFRELPDHSVCLQAGDLFFIDVGPIIDDHEADFGKTFTFDCNTSAPIENLLRLESGSHEVWKETADAWKNSHLNGIELMNVADRAAKKLGLILSHSMAGHRLGDFPHALFSKSSLFSFKAVPTSSLWVLEIHLIDKNIQRGAFFEDILTGF